MELYKCLWNRATAGELNRAAGAFGRGSSSAEWGSTEPTNEVSERGEVKGRTKRNCTK